MRILPARHPQDLSDQKGPRDGSTVHTPRLGVFLVVLVGVAIATAYTNISTLRAWLGPASEVVSIQVGNAPRIRATVVDTNEKREIGLSGHSSLAEGEGMLFTFPEVPEKKLIPVFWMKGMQFPIDIIWVRDGYVIGVEEDIPPPAEGTADADLPTYHPQESVDAVIEVPAGWVKQHGVGWRDEVLVGE